MVNNVAPENARQEWSTVIQVRFTHLVSSVGCYFSSTLIIGSGYNSRGCVWQ